MVESLFSDSMKPSKASGIYAIINRNNLKIYVGSAVCLPNRKRSHKHNILKGNHHSPYLQKAARKDPGSFEFSVIETVSDKSKLIAREQFWIGFYKSYLPENGYNLISVAGSRFGIKRPPLSPEHRRKISIANKGRVSAMKGKKHPASTILKMSAAHKGRQYTLGRIMPEDEKQRRSNIFRGRIFSPEWKDKIRKSKRIGKSVVKVSLSGEEIERFGSLAEAAESLSVKSSNLHGAISGRRKTAKGFIWRYV